MSKYFYAVSVYKLNSFRHKQWTITILVNLNTRTTIKFPFSRVDFCVSFCISREQGPMAILQALRDENLNDPRDRIEIAQSHAFYRPSLLGDPWSTIYAEHLVFKTMNKCIDQFKLDGLFYVVKKRYIFILKFVLMNMPKHMVLFLDIHLNLKPIVCLFYHLSKSHFEITEC